MLSNKPPVADFASPIYGRGRIASSFFLPVAPRRFDNQSYPRVIYRCWRITLYGCAAPTIGRCEQICYEARVRPTVGATQTSVVAVTAHGVCLLHSPLRCAEAGDCAGVIGGGI